jgi:hypothetical protein
MRQRAFAIVLVSLGACMAEVGDEPPTSTAESSLASTVVFYEKFDNLPSGNIDGHNGWIGNCVVVDDDTPPNKYLKCRNGDNATKPLAALESAGSYYLQADVWPNINVVNSTHGKLSLEGPGGRVFQIIVGCDNIRVAFQMNGPVATLLAFPCNATPPPPRYRVVCTWATTGNVLRCGAAPLPGDPTTFVNVTVPTPFRAFDHVAVSTFALPGATLFDKIYLERN